jgi:NAD(P)H-quinone oxidoreductase subunit 2
MEIHLQMNPTYFISFSAEICLVVTLLLLFLIELIKPNSKWLLKISASGLAIAFLSLSFQTLYSSNTIILNYSISGLNTIFKALLTLASLLCLLISQNYITCSGLVLSEFLIFFINAVISSLFLCGANDLITLFVALESLSLSSYLLSGYSKLDIRSNEAIMKYFLLGSASSAIIAYGFSWLYGLSQGEVEFSKIFFGLSLFVDNSLSINIALILILVGISFKLGIVPFHQWSPDVYEGSPTPVVAFFSVVSKIAAFVLCIKVLNFIFPLDTVNCKPILSALAAMTMIGGNLIALTQTNIKRLLAYSSISQAGYLMIAIIYGPSIGYVPTIIYLFIYIFMNIGAFGSIILLTLKTGTDQIRDFKGLYFKDPILTICLTICLLSLAGIPPFAGFFSKLYLFFLGWKDHLYWLIYIGLITSVISIYYYLRVIKVLITPEKKDQSLYVRTYQTLSLTLIPHNSLEMTIRICVIGSTILGFILSPLINLTQISLGTN